MMEEYAGIESPFEALKLALELAVTAPTEGASREAVKLAAQIVAGFEISEIEVARAKREVEEELLCQCPPEEPPLE